jgi:hypothetical protein
MAPSDNLPGLQGSWARPAFGQIATKEIIAAPDGSRRVIAFADVKQWFFSPPFDHRDHDAIREAMAVKLADPQSMMVQGFLRPDLDHAARHVRTWAGPNATLIGGRRWAYVGDLDKLPVPDGLGAADKWKDGVRWFRDNAAPEAIANAAWTVIPSSSSGSDPDRLSCRYFVLLDDGGDLLTEQKPWARGAKRAGYAVDDSVAQAGQPVYLARPIFRGMRDPLAAGGDLAFTIAGKERASIDWTEFAEADAVYVAALSSRGSIAASSGATWSARLAAALGGQDGFNTPLTTAARAAAGAGETEAAFVAAVMPLIETALDHHYAAALSATETIDDPARRRVAQSNVSHEKRQRRDRYCADEMRRLFRNMSRYETGVQKQIADDKAFLGIF